MKYYGGIDIGGSSVKLGIISSMLDIVASDTVPVDQDEPALTLREASQKLMAMADSTRAELEGCGIACPGPLSEPGTLGELPNLPQWRGFNVSEFVSRQLRCNTSLINDANAAALAEWACGNGRGSKMLVMVTLGTGIGGGIVCDGQVVEGAHGRAAEFGHIPVYNSKAPCGCGKKGCLEAEVGAKRLSERYSKFTGKKTSARQLILDAQAGEENALSVLRWAGTHIGFALAAIANALNPDKVVIGGGIAEAGDAIVKPVEHALLVHTMPAMLEDLTVHKAALGNDAGFVGAAIVSARE